MAKRICYGVECVTESAKIDITRLNAAAADFQSRLQRLLAWESVADDAVNRAVDGIIAGVRARDNRLN